jgi:PAS domain S-box-containing protein
VTARSTTGVGGTHVHVEAPAVVLERRLPPRATSAAAARQLVSDALEATPYAEVADSARVAVSELVTNALVHAGTEIAVQVCVDERGLLVEVQDGNPQVPVLRHRARESGTGRGLYMVEGLADDWGIYHRDEGKVVWFRIGPGAAGGPAVDVPGETDDDTVQVELRDFPLLLHTAWQEHSATLLREYLLMSLSDGDEGDAFQRHAEASEALHLLTDQVPVLDVAGDPHRVMSDAVEPGVTDPRLSLTVPRDLVASFEALESMMGQAVAAAEAGEMLVPATQPEVREMRRWLCGQVRSQVLTGAAPEAWVTDLHLDVVSDPVPPAGWTDDVSSAQRMLVAVSESGQVVAVSRPAADMLGYRPEELLGRRVLVLIPERFRQAHVAGMTLHMINGRRALLEHEVAVPMLHADGSEQEVRLTITSTPAGARRLFVAELGHP